MPLLLLSLLASLPLGAAPPAAPGHRLGVRVADFRLRDGQGRWHRLADLRERRLVVIVFLSVDCPLARLYAPRLAELSAEYGKRGVGFLALAPNRQDGPADLANFARRHRLPFPLLRDTGHAIADGCGAERSPEAFVLDGERRIRYRGRIDDQYEVGLQRPRSSRRELADGLDALLAGRPVSVPVTQAPGCPLSRTELGTASKAGVTWCRDVAPIIQRRCQACHRPGGAGPFSLISYRQASGWASAMREVVEEGRMPPWGANPRHGKFANDPSLTKQEKQTLFNWVDGGCPEGDRRDLPAPARFSDGWSIPGPDLVLSMPESFTVPAEGTIEYQSFRVDPGFTEDRWVKAAEVLPGNPAVVHHCNVFLQPPDVADPGDIAEVGKLGSYCLALTAPGTPPTIYPDGMAKRVPAGWKIVFVVHYQAIGSVQVDRTRLGLTFADPKTVRREVATRLLFEPDLRIPPGARAHTVSKTWEVEQDVLLLSMFPHMHLRGRSFRYELIHPDGREEILLDVPRYDFNWQHRYVLAEPRRLVAGSRLRATAVYDNSTDNPANPDPTKEVRAGTQSWDEMFNGYFDVAPADEGLAQPAPWSWQGPVRLLAVLLFVAGALFLAWRWIARAWPAQPS
jgi:peroxiredoxin